MGARQVVILQKKQAASLLSVNRRPAMREEDLNVLNAAELNEFLADRRGDGVIPVEQAAPSRERQCEGEHQSIDV